MKRSIVAAILCLMLVGSAAQAGVVFNEQFNYPDGPLVGNGTWALNWGGATSRVVSSGVALGVLDVGWNGTDVNCFFPDVFSAADYGTVEFDIRACSADFQWILCPANPQGGATNYNYSQGVGGDFGPYGGLYWTPWKAGSYDYGNVGPTLNPANAWYHVVMNLTKTGNTVNCIQTVGATTMNPVAGQNFTLTDARGLCSLEFYAADFTGYPAISAIDNIVVTSGAAEGGVIPEPAGLGLIGVALLALRKRRS